MELDNIECLFYSYTRTRRLCKCQYYYVTHYLITYMVHVCLWLVKGEYPLDKQSYWEVVDIVKSQVHPGRFLEQKQFFTQSFKLKLIRYVI